MFIAALFTIAKTWKQSKRPYIYRILLSHKKNEIMPFTETWMDLEIIILTEVSQTEKNKYYITYMWNLKKLYK